MQASPDKTNLPSGPSLSPEECRERWKKSTVAVCGLGGLGSNIASALAREGIGKLILTDFDRVEKTNLNRQQYKLSQVGSFKAEALAENLREISEATEIEVHCEKLSEVNYVRILKDADIVCEAFDNPEEKSRLINFVLENFPEKTIVSGSGMAGLGSPNAITTKRVFERLYVCGDGTSEVGKDNPCFGPRVQICASHQALTVLRLLVGNKEP